MKTPWQINFLISKWDCLISKASSFIKLEKILNSIKFHFISVVVRCTNHVSIGKGSLPYSYSSLSTCTPPHSALHQL